LLLLQLLSRSQLSQFCPETLVVASKYCQDFEKYGIHLTSSSQRAEVARLLALNQHYPARFNAALVRGLGGVTCLLELPAAAGCPAVPAVCCLLLCHISYRWSGALVSKPTSTCCVIAQHLVYKMVLRFACSAEWNRLLSIGSHADSSQPLGLRVCAG
jgi:hypothetical protein